MTVTTLHRPPPPADVHTLRAEAFRASHAAEQAGDPLESRWQLGVGLGITYGLAVERGGDIDPALETVAHYRQDATPGVVNVHGALVRFYSLNMGRRAQVAQASGVLHGFKLATAGRPDAVACGNCDGPILLDLTDHESCPAGTHPPTCHTDCWDELCGRRCAADGGLL